MRRIATAAVLLLVALCAGVPLAADTHASDSDQCNSPDVPQFIFGFADLQAQIGSAVGEAVTCEFGDPNGTGDITR